MKHGNVDCSTRGEARQCRLRHPWRSQSLGLSSKANERLVQWCSSFHSSAKCTFLSAAPARHQPRDSYRCRIDMSAYTSVLLVKQRNAYRQIETKADHVWHLTCKVRHPSDLLQDLHKMSWVQLGSTCRYADVTLTAAQCVINFTSVQPTVKTMIAPRSVG